MIVNTNMGNITGSKEVLNSIASALIEAADSFDNRGLHSLATYYRDAFNNIYDELNKMGYYK